FGVEEPSGIAVDGSGNAWVVGFTESANFPLVNPIRTSPSCVQVGLSCFDGLFISELNPAGSALLFSTYFGPTEFFQQVGIALDPQGNAYVVGSSNSSDFPAVNALPNAPTTG